MPRYMTRQGYEEIAAELDELWRVERPRIVDEVYEAAQLGDRSENAAYIFGKQKLRQIDGRMRYLRKKVQGVTLVDLDEQMVRDDVQFGAVVTVLDDEGQEHTWRLVDQDESNPKKGRISIQSPVGQALKGRKAEDYVEITLPKGRVAYEILAIRYGGGEP